MLSRSLATKLVNQNLIKPGTELTIKYQSFSIGGIPTISIDVFEFEQFMDECFLVHSIRTGIQAQYKSEDVMEIDGMQIERFVKSHDLTMLGDLIPPGKKRGRKPKRRVQ